FEFLDFHSVERREILVLHCDRKVPVVGVFLRQVVQDLVVENQSFFLLFLQDWRGVLFEAGQVCVTLVGPGTDVGDVPNRPFRVLLLTAGTDGQSEKRRQKQQGSAAHGSPP